MKALTAFALVAVIGLGVVVFMQQKEIVSLKTDSAASSSQIVKEFDQKNVVSAGTVVSEKQVVVDDSSIKIQYRCTGEIKNGVERIGDPQEDVSFCVGDYELVALSGNQTIVIASGHTTSAETSPVLLKVVSFGDLGNVLISYKPSCASTGDCGAGMAVNNVTHVLHVKEASVQKISNFPPSGTPVWNALYTKALFIPETCGGAGCDIAPIIAYDLTNDRLKDMTNEKAVGLGADAKAADATDPVGDRLPVWKSVEWLSGDTFTATLIKPDGSQKKVNGTF